MVLVGVIGLAVLGGVTALQAATTTAVDSRETTIATSPQYAQMPGGSGGPGDPPLTPIPDPPEDPVDPEDPEDPVDPQDPADPQDPVDPEDPEDPVEPEDPEPPPPTVAFDAAGTETRTNQQQNWWATVSLNVTNADEVTLSFTPPGTGTVTCSVVDGRCSAEEAGSWGPNVRSVTFTVVSVTIDGSVVQVDNGATLVVPKP